MNELALILVHLGGTESSFIHFFCFLIRKEENLLQIGHLYTSTVRAAAQTVPGMRSVQSRLLGRAVVSAVVLGGQQVQVSVFLLLKLVCCQV